MAAESPPTPHEIIAEPPPRPPLTPGAWLFLAHAGVLSPIVIYLFLGVWGIPFIAAVATPVALLFWFLNRLSDCEDRMSVSDEGVTLRVLRKGRPYGRPLSFRWDEVVKVTRWRAPGPKSPLLSVRLVKPKRPFLSWRLERPRPNPVRLGKALWQNPAFLDCLRRNVPPDRIKPEALDDVGGASRDAWWRRVCASVQILCAAVVAAAPVALATDSKYLLAFSMATSIICLVVSQGTLLFGVMVDWPFKPSVAVGALLVYVAVHPPWMLMAKDTLVGATQWPTFLGVVGGLAGLGLAAGVAMWTCPKWPLWRRVALLYALPALGFGAGWRGYDGIGDTKVGTGVIPAYLPWTPNGDGFLVREEESTFAVESRRWKETEPVPLKLRWYSADLERGHAVSLPNPGYTLAVGQEGALCATAAERGPTDLWFIPRRTDEAKKLLSLKGLARARLSPGRRYAVVRLNRQAKDGPWYRVDLDSGDLKTIQPPSSPAKAYLIGVRDDGALLLLKGSTPRDEKRQRVSRDTPIPKDGAFADPGEPFTLWAWHPDGSEPLSQLYGAKSPWCTWNSEWTSDRIHACRLALEPEPRWEDVIVDLSGDEPRELPGPTPSFQERQKTSPDGRFVAEVKQGPPGRVSIRDTVTGETRRLRRGCVHLDSLPPAWSPKGHRLLIQTMEWDRDPWAFKSMLDHRLQFAVRLVDLDAEQRRP